jgi:hypothetical protein
MTHKRENKKEIVERTITNIKKYLHNKEDFRTI